MDTVLELIIILGINPLVCLLLKNYRWRPYQQSKQFHTQLNDFSIIVPTTVFRVQNCNHTRFYDGDKINPEGLETESLKQIH